MGLPTRLYFKVTFLLVIATVRFSEMRVLNGKPSTTALVSSYYKTMKNTRRNTRTSIVRLYSRSLSSFVRITATMLIDAKKSNQKSDPDTLIELELLGPRRVVMRSKRHRTYVCFNKSSDVVIRKTFLGTECVFIKQNNRNNYATFQSDYNNTWYLGFSQRKINFGLTKSGRKTTSTQRSIQFVETS